MTENKLTQEDVTKLLSDPSGDTRAETAAKIANGFSAGALSDTERKLAEEIFHVMVKDAEVRVREALAQNLKENPNIPHDVAVSLARDVAQVALPVLQFSEVLTDDDLIAIVNSQSPEKQVAIAKRSSVSEDVADALVETGNEEAVTSLVANEGADISERSMMKVVDTLGDRESIQDAMVHRGKLPVTVSERLVTLVSEKFAADLIGREDLPDNVVTDLILQTRERAVITLSTNSEEGDVERLVKQLHENGRLTPSILLRGLCMGDMMFFEAGIAELAGVSLMNARQLIYDSGTLGLRTLCRKAEIPLPQLVAVRAAIDVSMEMEYDGREHDRERYSRRMIERIMTQYDDLGVEFESSDLNYLLTKMNQLPSDVLEDADAA
ncbi:MAG: DUF2336 domain-containing protein [Rhodospirillales bacterium]|nr:DUF2336 domain-containing protein [Alphaproteobacteria bacterium]MBL6947262.1 DUF2336 domain-containing protein [Rhodospirillales bacterium]